MPYIQRDLNGKISALSVKSGPEFTEYLSPTHPDLVTFLATSHDTSHSLAALEESDMEFVRITEDLVNTLVEKSVILFTDLPQAVQQKLLAREKLREQIQGERNESFMDEGEEGYF
ncbi:MAG: hypothetical protein OIF35_00420 [Cellvibrionaceae bacterium]|nr:hypothetical protein [Cellvibrionaceae bacterium]MCV6627604.1 hypothetical protein [Cellvibrionaceae bacterium]